MIGFSFFGKNLYNTIPIILGVYLYAKAIGQPFGEYVLHSMFGTALEPAGQRVFVQPRVFRSRLAYAYSALLSGLLVGFIIVPLSLRFLQLP